MVLTMTIRAWAISLFFAVLSLAATSASASILYDNGLPSGNSGLIISGNGGTNAIGAIAEDFSLASSSIFNRIGFYTIEDQDEGFWSGDLNVFVLGDAGGPNLGDILLSAGSLSGTASLASKVATGGTVSTANGPADIYYYEIDIPEVNVTAGDTYWLALYLGNPSNLLFWAYTDPNSSAGAQAFITSSGSWVDTQTVQLAFNLQYVPVPPTALLLVAGLLGAYRFSRRK